MNKILINISLFFFLANIITAQQPQCSADVYVNSYYVGTGPRFSSINHDIMVNNTGRCSISSVFVNVEFPPASPNLPPSFIRAEQFNITTGELKGYGGSIPQNSTKQGGRIVWDARDIRTPSVTLASVSCSCASSTPPPSPTSSSSPTSQATSSATSQPTSSPTHVPTSTAAPASTIVITEHSSSNAWWFALAIERADQTTSRVEIKDSSSSSTFSDMSYNSWGYWSYNPTKAIVLPVTIRITSNAEQQITLPSILSSFGTTSVDTHLQYPTSTHSSSSRSVKVAEAASTIHTRIHEGSSVWWLALEVTGNSEPIRSISVKDNQVISNYQTMDNTTWQYTVRQSTSTPISTPFFVQIQSVSGKTVEFPVTSFIVGKDINTGVQF
eukprot:TRINITY_DN1163_c1_g1_i1.p1 TRINITY_DN1163_c1_g1~~TRINITY_DN1163_c1_g1_i1.p1  ORF type:complete len:384 (+),score=105.24 TRINITY_DN1163_c1_g1_i1:137-1288(+)